MSNNDGGWGVLPGALCEGNCGRVTTRGRCAHCSILCCACKDVYVEREGQVCADCLATEPSDWTTPAYYEAMRQLARDSDGLKARTM